MPFITQSLPINWNNSNIRPDTMCRHSLVLLTFTLNTLHQALDHHNTASFTEYAFTSYHSQSRTHGNQASMHKHLDHVESTLNKEERKNHVSIPPTG